MNARVEAAAALRTREVVKARGLVRFLRAAHGRAYPRMIGTIREPSWFFYETMLPFLGTVAFVYVYKALGAPERFIGYVIMAGAAVALWSNVMWMMAMQLWWEKRDGNLEVALTAPCGLPPILFGMSVGGVVAAATRGAAVVLSGALIFHVHYAITQIPTFLAVFVVTLVALYGLGTALSALFLLFGREMWHVMNLFTEPVFFVTGFYFPVRTLGFWTGIGASIVPLTLALDALRQLLYPGEHPRLLAVRYELAILCGLAVLFFFVARAALRKIEWLARREGRLTIRYE